MLGGVNHRSEVTESPIEIRLRALRTTLGDDLARDLEDSVAPNTWRAYRSDLADFATWVAYTSAEWKAPEVVAAYLRTLEDGGAAYATITRRLTSIHKLVAIAAFAAGDLDYEDTPPNTPGSESRSRRSAAAWAPIRIKPTRSLPSVSSRSCCRSTPPPSPGSATWPWCWWAGTGRCAAPSSPVSNATTCHWARLRPTATEAVWLQVTRGDTVTRDAPITAAAINNVVQRRASAAGLENPLGYSAHSLRAGFVTEAKNRGIDEADIMRHTRHKSVQIMRRYDRTSGLWIRNATTGVSL